MARIDVAAMIAERLVRARKDAGLRLREAAQALGFENYQVLSKIEKGERPVRATELVQFAKFYQRSVGYFLAQDLPAARPDVLWRGGVEAPARKKVEQRFLTYCENYARLEELAGRGPVEFPLRCGKKVESFDEARTLGESTWRQMDLGSHPAKELRVALEERFGVKVLVEATAGAGSAASAMDSFGAGVLVNMRDAPWRMNFDIAHELFHLITWGLYESDELQSVGKTKTIPEKFADAFAAALLLPVSSVRNAFEARLKDGVLTYAECVTMAREFGVSTSALLYRLAGLRMVKKEEAEKAARSDDMAKLDKTERLSDWGNRPQAGPSDRFVALAFECLQSGRLSRGRFAELLGIHRNQIDAFLFTYGYDSTKDHVVEISTP
jgi:Zn-dependent peptidase ImmA (M78 family)/transcriptional regulator with XRE-family HTH domain